MNEDKGTRYRRAERTLRALEVGVAGLTLAVVAVTPLAARARDAATSAAARLDVPPGPATTLPVAAVVLLATLALPVMMALPLAIRREHGLARRFAQPTRAPRDVVRSRLRWLAACVVCAALAFTVFAEIEAVLPWGASLAAAALVLAIAGAVMVTAPWLVTVSPRVRPLSDEAAAARLHSMAGRAGLRLAGLHEWVFGADAGDANAALVGVLGRRRLLVSDTLLHGSPAEDVDAVVAHELGHHVHGHTARRVRLQAAGIVGAMLLAHLAAAGPARWVGRATDAADPAALPWMIGAGALAWIASRPWRLRQSRQHEAEADAYALALTGRPDALERVLTRLGARNLTSDEASLLTRAFFLTHPPIATRIAAARRAAAALATSAERTTQHVQQ